MTKAHLSEASISRPVGSGHAAPGGGDRLGLAATPTFAVMALWSTAFGGQTDVLCAVTGNGYPHGGMALMYALMSIFHAVPWLKLISRRWSGVSRS